MIVITGAAGFISSALVGRLNKDNYNDLVLVDDFSRKEKEINYINKKYKLLVNRENLFEWIENNHKFIQIIIHLGARTNTSETNVDLFNKLNLHYSQNIWNLCVKYGLPLIYASSAATYGKGDLGYDDNHKIIQKLKPLNPYGESKNNFDIWALKQSEQPYFWAGLKFFNVYGPNEYHKERMASVIFHASKQISKTGKMKLFKSHISEYQDGCQQRDFIYVKDVIEVIYFFMKHRKNSGIYNLGTGKARTFNDLALAVFATLNKKPEIEYIDIPEDIRFNYQYFTEANMNKLKNIGYNNDFYSLEKGINDYISNYLNNLTIY